MTSAGCIRVSAFVERSVGAGMWRAFGASASSRPFAWTTKTEQPHHHPRSLRHRSGARKSPASTADEGCRLRPVLRLRWLGGHIPVGRRPV